ncbi:MAG: MFS transporter [Methanomassiliicoccales archaeon]
MQVIVLMGIVSLLGDISYEGARSITGPYLAILGASSAVVGFVAGAGEFFGYALRLFSGYVADRTERYWTMTILGYGLIVSIPLIAFAGRWELVAVLLISERVGKAMRSPSRDAILSHATKQVGRGWGFGIHEALDQIGAIIGPLLFSVVFLVTGGYREGFTLLWIPFILMIAILLVARIKVPSPEKLENVDSKRETVGKGKLPRIFWLYMGFIIVTVIGFANFQLISYHLSVKSIVSDVDIPIFYAIAMGVDGLVALIIGRTYDKIGIRALVMIPFLTVPIPLLSFTSSFGLALAGVMLWGAVMGIHETIMRAAIADMTPTSRRGFAYGIFNTAYGASWFVGSAAMGLMYEFSVTCIVVFVLIAEIVSLPLFIIMRREARGKSQESSSLAQ